MSIGVALTPFNLHGPNVVDLVAHHHHAAGLGPAVLRLGEHGAGRHGATAGIWTLGGGGAVEKEEKNYEQN